MFCWKCGTQNEDNAFMCVSCGQILRDISLPQQRGSDKLEGYWLAIIWLSLLIPFIGQWVIVILSSVLYYHWKKEFPNKARTINKHGWLAFFAGHLFWVMVFVLSGGCGWLLRSP